MLHKGLALLVRQRIFLVDALRAHMAEFGITAPRALARIDYQKFT